MIQTVTGAFNKNHISFWIHIGSEVKKNLTGIVNIYMFIHSYNDFREHHLARSPQPMHQLERLIRILFF